MTVPKAPLTDELVTNDVLASVGTNPIAFAGADNPSAAWRLMLSDSPAAYALYRDLEEKDGQVSSALETRKDGVLRRERKVIAASSTADDERRAAFAREVLAAIPHFENILYELLDAVGYGFTVAEILWEQEGSSVFIRDIKARPQELFSFGEIGRPQVGALRFSHPSRVASRESLPLPEHKFLINSFRHGNRRLCGALESAGFRIELRSREGKKVASRLSTSALLYAWRSITGVPTPGS